ncbi:Hsp70 family protein [Streptomyces sp. NPDC051217]|uniref:Hsp70 family protein n=1 Tax=Streptomyces sp. NPDC051217 TaxID=3365644 RepID=UPI0037B08D8D
MGIDLGHHQLGDRRVGGRRAVHCAPNTEGNRMTPSVVAATATATDAATETGERLVGRMARRQAILNPKGTIYSAKRFVGRHSDKISDEAKAVAYDIVERDGGEAPSRCATSCTRPRRSAHRCCANSPTTPLNGGGVTSWSAT